MFLTVFIMTGVSVQFQSVEMKRFIEGLLCKTIKKFKATIDSKHNYSIAPNILNREFTADAPNQKWVGQMSKRMTTDLVNDDLISTIWSRKPLQELIWYADRGSQYASHYEVM
jgi:putative transposase